MAINSLIATSIYNALNVSAVNTNLSANGAIYSSLAPKSAAFPYIIFQWGGGGKTNLTPTEDVNVVYQIKAVSDVLATARTIADSVETVLKDKPITITGYTNYILFMEQMIDFAEVDDDGTTIYHVGAEYRIRFSE